jgi:hypothetical protein
MPFIFLFIFNIYDFFIFEKLDHVQFKIKIVFFLKKDLLLLFLWKRTNSFNIEKVSHV